MSGERLFLDTWFVQALLSKTDNHHELAKKNWPRVVSAAEVWITEANLLEIGNALSEYNRSGAHAYIKSLYESPPKNLRLQHLDSELIQRALNLYGSRSDKTWGLVDCISFIVMKDNNLSYALTGDNDFKQAGFVILEISPS